VEEGARSEPEVIPLEMRVKTWEGRKQGKEVETWGETQKAACSEIRREVK